jgi:hypothetical protein
VRLSDLFVLFIDSLAIIKTFARTAVINLFVDLFAFGR